MRLCTWMIPARSSVACTPRPSDRKLPELARRLSPFMNDHSAHSTHGAHRVHGSAILVIRAGHVFPLILGPIVWGVGTRAPHAPSPTTPARSGTQVVTSQEVASGGRPSLRAGGWAGPGGPRRDDAWLQALRTIPSSPPACGMRRPTKGELPSWPEGCTQSLVSPPWHHGRAQAGISGKVFVHVGLGGVPLQVFASDEVLNSLLNLFRVGLEVAHELL